MKATAAADADRSPDGLESRIIDHPHLKSFLQNVGEWSFTTVMWALWIYLFMPLVNMALWTLSGHHIYATVVEAAHYRDLAAMVCNAGGLALAIFLILCGWGYYNYHCFGKRERRKTVSPASRDALAAFFNATPEAVVMLRKQKEVIWEDVYDRH